MEPFKNNFSEELVGCIADQLGKHLKPFNRSEFLAAILPQLESLELKERSQLIADTLHTVLPTHFKKRNAILLAMLHPLTDSENSLQSDDTGIRGWGMLPLCAVVGQYGIDDFDASLKLLKEMTKRFSSEFDIRYFLLADQARVLAILSEWLDDSCQHVRRLISEGTRPRLPWAMQLPQIIADPTPILPLLDALKDDEEEYVRRSVANNLNDIAKDHPDLVAGIAEKWMLPGNKKREKLLRHACRTLIKQGHAQTLSVFGYSKPKITLTVLDIETLRLKMGNPLVFSACIKSTSKQPQSLIIDYLVHHQKSNGKLSPKVFKWKTMTLQAGETITINRRHPIREITTRRYYEGTHALSLRINGEDFGYEEFHLIKPQ